jgi:[NiFe] hydrogenase diaphorase moiety small subunit
MSIQITIDDQEIQVLSEDNIIDVSGQNDTYIPWLQITIDGQKIQARPGDNIIDVAGQYGVYIPSLCYVKGEPCLGTCRTCYVKVNGNVMAACTVPVADGMQIEVNEPEITDMRKALVELLFSEGNHNCPSCEKSGRCELQSTGYEVGMMVSRFPYRFTPHVVDHASKTIFLQRDRCIFCQRCVDMVRDNETGKKIFSISGRGTHARIEIDVELANKMPPEQVRQASDLCPVGCIIDKTQGYDVPIGKRKFEIKSIKERALERTIHR